MLVVSCNKDRPPPASAGQTVLSISTPVYDEPNGQITGELSPGDYYQLNGEVSRRLYPRFRDTDTLLEPYLQVFLQDSSLAWVYADPSFFDHKESKLEWQWKNRLQALLSTDDLARLNQIRTDWMTTETQSLPILLSFQAIRQLRAEIEAALAIYPALPAEHYTALLPGCWSFFRDGKPAWWLDYNAWLEHSSHSSDSDAEKALFQFYVEKIYPPDGIEYTFPSWQFPVSREKAHSLLGRGIHFELLQALDSLSTKHPFVRTEWESLKTNILADITNPFNTYWEAWPKVEEELLAIRQHEAWLLLGEEDLMRINTQYLRLQKQATNEQLFHFRNK